LFFVPMFQ